MIRDSVQLHNVAEARSVDGRDGRRLQRVPEEVRTELNESAQDRMLSAAGAEIRFVPDGPVEVTLSTATEEITVRPFWGPFQRPADAVVGPEPTTIELAYPADLDELDPAVVDEFAFHPRVCRLRLPGIRGDRVYFHGVDGDVRPPRDAELPDRRYLAYGTSITEGADATAEHLTYASQTAERLGADLINLGSSGSAYCDAAIAEHIAARDDWDVATLALSVNMVGEFPLEEFRRRAAAMVDRVAGENPDKPVACITIYPNAYDVIPDEDLGRNCDPFREALREIVAETPHDDVSLIEGPEILADPSGLTTDLLHPGDRAMIRMGERLAERLEPLFED